MKKQNYVTFNEAKAFVSTMKLKNAKEWEMYCKSGMKPENIPNRPNITYKASGWTSWFDFLDMVKKPYLPFWVAQKIVHELNLKGRKEWLEYCKSGNKPSDIPTTPNVVYKNKGWVSFIDWLGKPQKFLSFKQAKNLVKKIK